TRSSCGGGAHLHRGAHAPDPRQHHPRHVADIAERHRATLVGLSTPAAVSMAPTPVGCLPANPTFVSTPPAEVRNDRYEGGVVPVMYRCSRRILQAGCR